MKTIYVTTIHVHELPLSLVAEDGGNYDNLELETVFPPDLLGQPLFTRSYAGLQKFALEAGADPEDWPLSTNEPIFSVNLEGVFT